MRILLDEDTPIQLVEILRCILVGHDVQHVYGLKWGGKKDRAVLADAKSAGYDAIVTNDAKQLDDPDETASIRKSKLHHIRYSHKHPGRQGLALSIAAVIASMPAIVEELEAAEKQLLVSIVGLSPTGRHKAVDPERDPPRYWK